MRKGSVVVGSSVSCDISKICGADHICTVVNVIILRRISLRHTFVQNAETGAE